MVNIKVPLNPVQKRGLWPPKGGREYPVLDTDDWRKIAAREHIDAWAFIEFNFQTHVPEEVNWYLRELVGRRHSRDGGRNYAFIGADPSCAKSIFPLCRRRPHLHPYLGPTNSRSSSTMWSIRTIHKRNDSSACSRRWRTAVMIA